MTPAKVNLATVTIVWLVFAFSFLPFMQPRNEWTGYGSMGSHFYKNDLYEIHYGEVSTGVGKPQIFLLIAYDRTPIVEISDHRSEINGERIHPNFPETVRTEGDALVSMYGDDFLVKRVKPDGDTVKVSYELSTEANLTVTLWRWYYHSVENITRYNLVGAELPPSGIIHYTFFYNDEPCICEVMLDPIPGEVLVYGDEDGVNKIVLTFKEARKVSLTFRAVEKPSVMAFFSSSSSLTYPLIALAVLGIFLALKPRLSMLRLKFNPQESLNIKGVPLKPHHIFLIAAGVRAALAPFFMHVWDVTTLQEALNDFVSGRSVYSAVIERTLALRHASGVEANYEGYAYLPHPLLAYLPFYLVYVRFFGVTPAIIGGHREAQLQLVTPNVYFFLFLVKVPVILADASVSYLLAMKTPKIGLLYALSPYSIMVTSVWGHFDPLAGLFLMLAIMLASKRSFASGFLYGFSLMKLFTAVAFPALVLILPRNRRAYMNFLSGLFASQLPTLYYFIQDTNAMLSVLLFHSARSPGGVNVYNLAPKLYCYQLQSAVNRVAFAILSLALLMLLAGRWMRVEADVAVLSVASYLAVGPVVNEQYLAVLLPSLFMFDHPALASALSAGYLAYALLYSGPAYFMKPIEALPGCGQTVALLEESWASLFANITPQLLYAIAVACSLTLLFSIQIRHFGR